MRVFRTLTAVLTGALAATAVIAGTARVALPRADVTRAVLRHGSAALTARMRFVEGDDGSRSCPGFARHIYYGRDLVTMRIPRSCVKNPRWVRLGIFNQLSFRAHGPRYFDTPLNHDSPASDATQTRRLYVSKP